MKNKQVAEEILSEMMAEFDIDYHSRRGEIRGKLEEILNTNYPEPNNEGEEQRYEHKVVSTRGTDDKHYQRRVQEMEKDGWELCAMASHYTMIFKRPKNQKK